MPTTEQSQKATMDPAELLQRHNDRFGVKGHAYRAPGRVNLIGEHTDYSGGLILPAAIDFSTVAVVSRREDRHAVVYSENFGEEVRVNLDHFPQQGSHTWSDYPLGVYWALREKGINIRPFNLNISGNVPLGAGLSSSASIEVAVAFALLSLTDTTLSREEIALLCQHAENGFVGANCGIMDQFIACFGERDHAIMVDTRSLAHSAVPIPTNVHLVIANSLVKHSHAGGEYNTRRAEVDEATRVLHQADPKIEELRDATLADLEAARANMPQTAFLRSRHIITENARVEATVAAFKRGDLKKVGQLMAQAHASYRDDFAASCPEVEVLIELASRLPGLIGARLTGGGFGGCTVNLVEAAQAASFRSALRDGYKERLGIDAEMYHCHASAGAGAIGAAS